MCDDPFSLWLIPPNCSHNEWLKNHFLRVLKQSQKIGYILTTEDLLGVAIWLPPAGQRKMGRNRWSILSLLRDMYWYRGRVKDIKKGFMWLENARPKQEYWYLQLLATRSEDRRKGLGTALVQHQRQLCEATKTPIVVETTNRQNMFFYARQGFRIGKTFTLPHGPDVFSLIKA